MAIIDYKDNICRDTNVLGNNVYLDGEGQGCCTIWFKSVPIARKAFKKDGVKTGRDLADCTKCQCHYSCYTKEYEKYPEFLCREAKKNYAKQFE